MEGYATQTKDFRYAGTGCSRLDIIDSLLPVHDHQYDSLFKSNGLAALVFPKT